MKHCAGIDLHGTTSVIVGLDDDDRVCSQQRLPNELGRILEAFGPFRGRVRAWQSSSPIIGTGS